MMKTLGHLLEGAIEQDPFSNKLYLRTEDAEGRPVSVDLQELLEAHVGQEVRFTLVSFESLQKLAEMVERGEEISVV